MPKPGETCENCAFCYIPAHNSKMAYCHYDPPMLEVEIIGFISINGEDCKVCLTTEGADGMWPTTGRQCWCGKYQPKSETSNEVSDDGS